MRSRITVKQETAVKIVLATCALHNFLLSRKDSINVYTPLGSFDVEDADSGTLTPGSWRSEITATDTWLDMSQQSGNRSALNCAKRVRDTYRQYFNNEGAVSWQTRMIQAKPSQN